MTIRTTYNGHQYAFVSEYNRWVLLWCACPTSGTYCGMPFSYKRGELNDCRRRKAVDRDYDKLDYLMVSTDMRDTSHEWGR